MAATVNRQALSLGALVFGIHVFHFEAPSALKFEQRQQLAALAIAQGESAAGYKQGIELILRQLARA
jgi:hypothetical protein